MPTTDTAPPVPLNLEIQGLDGITDRLPAVAPDLEGLSAEQRHLRLLDTGQKAGLWELLLMDDRSRWFFVRYQGGLLWLPPWEVSGFIHGVLRTLRLPTTAFIYRFEPDVSGGSSSADSGTAATGTTSKAGRRRR